MEKNCKEEEERKKETEVSASSTIDLELVDSNPKDNCQLKDKLTQQRSNANATPRFTAFTLRNGGGRQ